ncbi:hypothetical protein DPMN_105456 [Dreissena polymorpha]|uniref:Uncharacterized protein n=1 Tax=Dreissena polymorpha TaxID=45954 RepID=A0A9D4HBN4_DREPO|nr:hypothetical protein DPMN_105456 [Dreissena polymorpha]
MVLYRVSDDLPKSAVCGYLQVIQWLLPSLPAARDDDGDDDYYDSDEDKGMETDDDVSFSYFLSFFSQRWAEFIGLLIFVERVIIVELILSIRHVFSNI